MHEVVLTERVNRLNLMAIGTFVAMALSPFAASAHHGWGGYRTEIKEKMTITKVRWMNPHDMLMATDADGVEWRLLLAPPVRNRRFGFGPGTVEVGDVVEILGAKHPSRSEAKIHVITLNGSEVYRYYYESGRDSIERLGGTVQEKRHGRD